MAVIYVAIIAFNVISERIRLLTRAPCTPDVTVWLSHMAGRRSRQYSRLLLSDDAACRRQMCHVFNGVFLNYAVSHLIGIAVQLTVNSKLLHLQKPTRSMRSPYTQMLTVPRHNLSFGSRAFRISVPKNWNTLPLEVRQSHSLSTFRNRLKTFCFRSAYPS